MRVNPKPKLTDRAIVTQNDVTLMPTVLTRRRRLVCPDGVHRILVQRLERDPLALQLSAPGAGLAQGDEEAVDAHHRILRGVGGIPIAPQRHPSFQPKSWIDVFGTRTANPNPTPNPTP